MAKPKEQYDVHLQVLRSVGEGNSRSSRKLGHQLPHGVRKRDTGKSETHHDTA